MLKAVQVTLRGIEISPVNRKVLFNPGQQRDRQLANWQCTCNQALMRQLGHELTHGPWMLSSQLEIPSNEFTGLDGQRLEGDGEGQPASELVHIMGRVLLPVAVAAKNLQH